MAEKSDEEIIKELGLETSNELSAQEALDTLSFDNEEDTLAPVEESVELVEDKTNNSSENINKNAIENEDRDDLNQKKHINNNDIEEDTLPMQKKQPKIFKILISIAVFLFLILATGAVLYFTGFFDPEPIKVVEKKEINEKIEEEITFNTKDIDKNRLNKKLTMLTKREIMNKEELETEENKIKEEKRKKEEAEEKKRLEEKKKEEELVAAQLKRLEEEKKILENQQKMIKDEQEKFLQMQIQAKEELAQAQEKLLKEISNSTNKKSIMQEEQEESYMEEESELIDEESSNYENENSKSFLSFINVATIKGELYKSFLDKAQKYDKNISLCRDNKNRIVIYSGPYDSLKQREKVFSNLLSNGFKESYLIDLTNEEYKKRCKY